MAGPGALVVGRYRLVKRLADGGMGTVWEGWDERLLRPVAIKQLHPQHGATQADADLAKNRVLREARLTARLHHPHAVPVYDVVDDEGQPCLIMQYLPSTSLQQLVNEKGVLTAVQVARLGSEIASALAEAHRAGIVHRDVKPGNVLIAEDGTAKITDFGISHAMDDITVTSTGMVSGTPAYLAPEVARGMESTYASDVFSLGSTLHLALEGSPPFGTDSNPMAMLHRVASGRLTPLRRGGPLAGVLGEMLAVDPADRPPMIDVERRLDAVARDAALARADEPTGVLSPPTKIMGLSPAARTKRAKADRAASARPVSPPILPGRAASPLPPEQPDEPVLEHRRGALVPVLAVLLVIGIAVVAAVALLGDRGKNGLGAAAPSSPASVSRSVSTSASTPSTPASRRATNKATRSTSAPSSVASSVPAAKTKTKTKTKTKSTTRAAGQPSATELVRAIDDYYDLLPGNTDEGWQRLTAGFQQSTAQGRDTYERFWNSVQSVTASGGTASAPDTVQTTVTYVYRDGRTYDELTTFRLVRENGILKIADSHLDSSVLR